MSTADIRPTCPKCHGSGRAEEEEVVVTMATVDAIKAAEERGRRAGIEEAAKVAEAMTWLKREDREHLKQQLRAFAPRDSAS